MDRKSLKTQTLIRIGVVFAILILLNVVSVRLFGRLDVTRNKVFSLSDASKELVRNLDDKVTVKAYFTEELPAPYNNNRRLVLDQLNEYKAYSKGKLQYEFIDPTGEKGEQEAQQQGVGPVQVQVVKEDKFEVKRGFMGLVFLYEDKKEVIPVIQNMASLEYEISSIVKKLTSKSQKKIGFLAGQGEPALTEVGRAQQLLAKQYQVTSVDVSKNTPVPPDVTVLIVMAPTVKFGEPQKYQIDQFIMRGGKVAFLLNKVDANLQQRFGRAIELNLEDMLEHYGLRINPDMVRDAQCASISIVQQQMGFNIQSQVPFPYLPIINDFSKDNPAVKDLQGVVLFFASSLDTVNIAQNNVRADVLARSSKQSGRLSTVFMIDPLARFTREDFAEKGLPLAIALNGQFKSFYANKLAPADTAAGSMSLSGNTIGQSPDTRIILVGDGDFARDQYLGGRDNLNFFANMVDYLADDAGLITIRSKDVTMPPLEQVSDATKKLFKYGNLAIPPLLVIGAGLLRWRMRKARKKAMELH